MFHIIKNLFSYYIMYVIFNKDLLCNLNNKQLYLVIFVISHSKLSKRNSNYFVFKL